MVFSVEEGTDVGQDGETPVVEDYGIPTPYRFTGRINKVTVELKEMKATDRENAHRAQEEAGARKALLD